MAARDLYKITRRGHNEVKASIVVPCHNEEENIGRCLESLINQECNFLYEIIVVDDESSDRTAEYAKAFIRRVKSKCIILKVNKVPRGGPARARNIGLNLSRGEYVLFIDADCSTNSYWIGTLVNEAEEKRVAGIGGPYRTKENGSRIADYVGLELEYRELRMIENGVDFIRSANACFRRDVLMEVGGFDEDFTSANAEDSDLCFRILQKGYDLHFNPKAWVWHRHPSTLQHYLKQQFTRGVWRILLYIKNPRRIKGDTYAGLGTLTQPLLPLLTLSIATLLAILNSPHTSVTTSIAGLIVLILMNAKFLRWLKIRRSSTFMVFSIGILLLRTLVWSCGGICGSFKFLTIKNRAKHAE